MRNNLWPRVVIAALALGACGGDESTPPLPDPLTFAVGEPGPFGVGYRTLPVTYTSPAGPRSILVHLWYPSESPSGEHPAYSGLFPDDRAFIDAPVARPAFAQGFPVLVHSHGHLGFAGNSAAIMRHFASHGWVAVAPDHTDNTLSQNIEPRPTRLFFERPLDIRATLDAVAALPADDPLGGGACDTSGVAMTGHSFGTYTTWVSGGAQFDGAAIQTACDEGSLPSGMCTAAEIAVFDDDLSEPRVKVAIPMAGGARDDFFGMSGYDAVEVPFLLMTGSEDEVGAAELFERVADDTPLTWIDVAGGCHQLFGLGGCKQIPDDVGFSIVNSYALAFARRYVLGDDDPAVAGIVAGSESVSSMVTFQKK